MITWWATLSVTMKLFWGITIAASVIFVIQTVLTFIGADGGFDDGSDIDFDTDGYDGSAGQDGMNLYTFRNFVNFFLGFGWTAVLLRDSIESTPLLLAIAICFGAILVFLVMMIFKWLYGMQSSGNINVYKSAAGCVGKVYLTVPASRGGTGKVQITINNAVREYEALTDSEETLSTGCAIRVVEVIDNSTLLVEKLDSLIV